MKSLPPSAHAIPRTCLRGRRTRTRSSSMQAGAGDAGARHGPRRNQAGRHPVSRQRSRRDVFADLRSDVRDHRRQPRHARFAGREFILPIHREMAEDILNQLVVEQSFDMAYSEDAELGHAFAVPFEYVIGKRDIPVIPFFTNVYVPPLPTPQRCAAFGKAIAEIVKGRKERVAIIASGGMSHFPGHDQVSSSRIRFRSLAAVSQFEAGNTDALLEHDRHRSSTKSATPRCSTGRSCSARSARPRAS